MLLPWYSNAEISWFYLGNIGSNSINCLSSLTSHVSFNLLHLVCFYTQMTPPYTKDCNKTTSKTNPSLSDSWQVRKLVHYLYPAKKHIVFESIPFWACFYFPYFFQPEMKEESVLKFIFTKLSCMSKNCFQRHSHAAKKYNIPKRNTLLLVPLYFLGSRYCYSMKKSWKQLYKWL